MKIITGINKKKFIKKIKILSYRIRIMSLKYNINKYYKIIYFIPDHREEVECGDVILIISGRGRYNKILKIIK